MIATSTESKLCKLNPRLEPRRAGRVAEVLADAEGRGVKGVLTRLAGPKPSAFLCFFWPGGEWGGEVSLV